MFNIGADASYFTITSNGEFRNAIVLDYDRGTTSYTQLSAVAVDGNYHTVSANVTVTIVAVDDEPPVCPLTMYVSYEEEQASMYDAYNDNDNIYITYVIVEHISI